MEACGLITEYNPFHQGHLYHLQTAKKETGADCMIAVMSGNFLQRGEPAIIDKYQRTKAALDAGVDLIVELPFVYAVQNSDFFAKGAISILSELGVSSICFGSETGKIDLFLDSYTSLKNKQPTFQQTVRKYLDTGLSFPEASRKAYQEIGLMNNGLDLTKPNNILGFSYIKAIKEKHSSITAYTINRIENNYHDVFLTGKISSATSIRKEILSENKLTEWAKETLTENSASSLHHYKKETGIWHQWENYFPFLQYKVATMTTDELNLIHGMEEGLEYRLKKTAINATDFTDWMKHIKTKRYTWTRLQRVFVHLLVNCKKEDVSACLQNDPPYVRILGMNSKGRLYLNQMKKNMHVPLISQIQQSGSTMMNLEERAASAYYSVLHPSSRHVKIQQEYLPPILTK